MAFRQTVYRQRLHFPQIPLIVMPKGNQVTTKGIVQFRASPKLNKPMIRQMLQKVYGVGVIKVNTMNYRGKVKTAAGTRKHYKKPDWKKAVVTVDNTDFLDLLSATSPAPEPQPTEQTRSP